MDSETLSRLKLISLMELHYSPWTDTSRFQKGEKTKLIDLIKLKYTTLTADEITREFDEIVHEKLFHNGAPIDTYPVCR